MHNLPSEQNAKAEKAARQFQSTGKLTIHEPCDCGWQVRHNNGGNYHQIIWLRKDSGKVFVKYGTTCELVDDGEWEPCVDPSKVIRDHADWL